MEKKCVNCGLDFEIVESDFDFYKKMQVPNPKHCPSCRQQRRLAFRNESLLYYRKCDFSGEKIISIYSEDKPFKVYKTDYWWSDKWDSLQYGQEFDFNRPFFEQFKDLQLKVPRPSLITGPLENSPFVNQAWYSKNSHMCFDMGFSENALYCHNTYHCKNVVDNNFIRECELCYWMTDCQKCYSCVALKDCSGCFDSYFSFDCKGCDHVAFSYNLRNKSYYLYNKPVYKEDFEQFVNGMKDIIYQQFCDLLKDFDGKVIKKAMHKLNHNLNTVNCSGDYILNSKNAINCYDCEKSEDIKYCFSMDERIFDCMDLSNCSICELVYEGMCVNANNAKFCTNSYIDSSDLMYCDLTMSSSNCFGCIGFHHKKYCILNKQCTKEEYEKLVPKIIEHMKKTGEWGEFFPVDLFPFAYNETLAYEYYPLTKEEALKNGYKWKESDKKEYQKQTYVIPDKISDVSENVINEILVCEKCGKNYKIILQELNFYKKLGIPIPHKCPTCRHLERFGMRNPRVLHERKCDNCGVVMSTTYSKEYPAKIYCEKCYLEAVY